MDTILQYGFEQLEWQIAILSFLVAFLISSVIAAVYERTFQGLSYSRGLVQTMVLGSLISCLLMIAIGDNIARGIGIVGSLAIIRFRTNLRDPRDLVFLFASLGVGVAAGVRSYSTAVIGGLMFCAVVVLLYVSPFGTRRKHDGVVRFQVPGGPDTAVRIGDIMQRMTRRFVLVTMRDVAQGDLFDYTYQVKLAHPDESLELMKELEGVEGIRGLTYTNHESTVEI